MEDMAWVLYALLGTQVILIVILIVVALLCHNALVGVSLTLTLQREIQIDMAEALQSIRGNVYSMRAKQPIGRVFDDDDPE